MREIKFRAYFECSGLMESFDFNDVYDDAFSDGEIGSDYGTVYLKPDVKVMQYTGLKDKNGVEIYEGDVLRQFTQHLVVMYHDAAFWAGGYQLRERWHSELEVIGNIYDNPELLKERTDV